MTTGRVGRDTKAARPRLFIESDRAAAAALLVGAYPHRWHEPRGWGTSGPNDSTWVVDTHGTDAFGTLAAYLSLWRVDAQQYRMDLVVAPAHRGRGIGSALLDFLIVQARLANASSLQARSYADHAVALTFLAARGFEETMRMTGLELPDVTAVTAASVGELAQAVCALDSHGLRITTLADVLRSDPLAWERLHAANQAAQFGWPEPDPLANGDPRAPETTDQFRARSEQVRVIPEACFVATDGVAFVGYSALTAIDPGSEEAGSAGTAVLPAYRGRGIATALKACCIAWARDRGIRRLSTSSGNPAMVRVNEKFGFRRTYTEVRLVRRFWAEAGATVSR